MFVYACRHAMKTGNVDGMRAIFDILTRKIMRPETKHAKMLHMVKDACAIAAEFGNVKALTWIESISYYDVRNYPIDEVAVRHGQLGVLKWCNERDFALERYIQIKGRSAQVTLLGLAVMIQQYDCAQWIYDNITTNPGDLLYIMQQVGGSTKFTPLLGKLIMEKKLSNIFVHMSPRLTEIYKSDEPYKCALFCMRHTPAIRDLSQMKRFSVSFLRRLRDTVYIRDREELEGWWVASLCASRRGVPTAVWRTVFRFIKGEQLWRPRTMERRIRAVQAMIKGRRRSKKRIRKGGREKLSPILDIHDE